MKEKEKTENITKQLNLSAEKSDRDATKADNSVHVGSEFMAKISHKIRTPMNAIIGFSEVLAETNLTEDQKNHVEIIRESGKNLLQLINDILDFSKIESGQLDTNVEDCALGRLLAVIESLMRPEAKKKNLEFAIQVNGQLPATILTDQTRVKQCLTNLIINAIKFTEKGHVFVNVSPEHIESSAGNNESFIRFDVEDTGIGIAPDRQDTIFEPFIQTDGIIAHQFSGTGLGLPISKQLAQLLGGELTVESKPNKGSVFTLRVAAGVDISSQPALGKDDFTSMITNEAKTTEENAVAKMFRGRILVAEDCKTNQTLIKFLLEQLGLEVTIAEDGVKTVEKGVSEQFDLIFMDIQMPNMNGYEATIKLREKGITIPIVALTAHAMKGDDQKCFAAGCDEYLTKPINRTKLLDVLDKHLPANTESLTGKIDSINSEVEELTEICTDLSESCKSIENSDDITYNRDLINWSNLIEMCGNEEVIKQVTAMFLKDSPTCINSISEAIKEGNPKHVGMYAHSLKGAALQISATNLSELAHRMEAAGKEKKMAIIPALFEEVKEEFAKVVSFMSKPDWIEIAKEYESKHVDA
ncbi:MAG: response regulator [Planctomycetota bacterium]|jgi:CheY-like chemotaxis protein/HPt (histidine-containing phosphotransfer) domain-containing protein